MGFILWEQNLKKVSNQPEEKNPYLQKGYTKEEIKRIETLNTENQSYLLKEDYQIHLIDYLDTIEFDEAKLKDYIQFSKLYNLSIQDIVYIVNHHYDDIDVYDEKTVSLMHESYYIHAYLDRYLRYSNIHSAKDMKAVIIDVNSNLDYAFYTQDYTVDLEKQYLILVNKYYKLTSDYVPSNLVTIEAKYGRTLLLEGTVYEQYKLMWNAANEEGLSLYIRSPYRSYATQQRLYNDYVAQDGKEAADTYSARPGYSEHQTGLAFDVTSPTTNFDTFSNSREFKWLLEHAHEYGFILRYPEGKEKITGYIYEPWHYRYVGKEAATIIHETGMTLEEYYAYYVR